VAAPSDGGLFRSPTEASGASDATLPSNAQKLVGRVVYVADRDSQSVWKGCIVQRVRAKGKNPHNWAVEFEGSETSYNYAFAELHASRGQAGKALTEMIEERDADRDASDSCPDISSAGEGATFPKKRGISPGTIVYVVDDMEVYKGKVFAHVKNTSVYKVTFGKSISYEYNLAELHASIRKDADHAVERELEERSRRP
jgi:hypothetical protein